MSRQSPEEYLVSRVGSLTNLTGRVKPNLQPPDKTTGELEFPFCVYRSVGGSAVTTFEAGPHPRSYSFRLDFRSRYRQADGKGGYEEAAALANQALAAVRAGGRLRELSGPTDLYDAETGAHRRIWTVTITV